MKISKQVVQPVPHRLSIKEVAAYMDEASRERLTDKVYRSLIDLYAKQEGVQVEYVLRPKKKEPETEAPA